ncbi:MAG: nucleotidyl transferase AbiEii/AbiGii toxin family protein [Verrucomicrobiota bacterium]
MITRFDIEERVREWGLRDSVVEKDYVLGWLLWGIGTDEALGLNWAFKGGTCLKKCYLETYRFSEDLDFTVLPGGPVREEDVRPLLTRVLAKIYDASGIQFQDREPMLKTHSSGNYTQGRVYYRGPRNAPEVSSIILDLSASEKVARPTVLRKIAHAFPDELPGPAEVRCYSFEEVFAEKIRAMGERCRPRDLYDIINLFRRRDLRSVGGLVREVLLDKCHSKGVEIPTMLTIEQSPQRAALSEEWSNMLAHQLPALPPFEAYWTELADLFRWLEGNFPEEDLAIAQVESAGEQVEESWTPPPTVYVWGQGVPIETIRFAAANHLCLDLGYQNTIRQIEPYALRRTKSGRILLVAVKSATRETRTYRIDRIQSVKVTNTPFKPVFRVELGASGQVSIPQLSHIGTKAPLATRSASPRSRVFSSGHGPTYVFKCGACGREFKRKSMNNTLKPHKGRGGWNCNSMFGHFVRTEY